MIDICDSYLQCFFPCFSNGLGSILTKTFEMKLSSCILLVLNGNALCYTCLCIFGPVAICYNVYSMCNCVTILKS